MSNGRHSYVPFYPSDWLAGTARLPRLHRSVYFDICCYNWDTAQPCPLTEVTIMIHDLKGGGAILSDLIDMGKLHQTEDGALYNARAMAEAEKALDLYNRKREGGAKGGSATKTPSRTPSRRPKSTPALEPEPEPEPTISDDKSSSPALQPEHIVEEWNEMASRIGLPTIRKLTPERRRKMLARIRGHPLDEWIDALNAIERCTWMHGDNDRGWRADIDFLLRPSVFQKLIEGSYDRQAK